MICPACIANAATLAVRLTSSGGLAALVKNGAVGLELFSDSNGEHIAAYSPQFAASFEKLIDATPDGRKRVAETRERMKAIQAQRAQARHKRAKSA